MSTKTKTTPGSPPVEELLDRFDMVDDLVAAHLSEAKFYKADSKEMLAVAGNLARLFGTAPVGLKVYTGSMTFLVRADYPTWSLDVGVFPGESGKYLFTDQKSALRYQSFLESKHNLFVNTSVTLSQVGNVQAAICVRATHTDYSSPCTYDTDHLEDILKWMKDTFGIEPLPELETPPPPTPEQFESLQEGTELPGVKEYRDGLTEEVALKKFPWLKEAIFKDAVLGLAPPAGWLSWYGGTWKGGFWEDGLWKGGFWEKGIWEGGTWKDGTWRKGTWKGGFWEKGTWEDGTWKGGTWAYGHWKSGWWKYGHWKGGYWDGGVWEDGTWKGGVWRGGIWEKGTWGGGTWRKGTWEDGYIWDGSKYVPSKVSPKEFSNQGMETPPPPTPEQFEHVLQDLGLQDSMEVLQEAEYLSDHDILEMAAHMLEPADAEYEYGTTNVLIGHSDLWLQLTDAYSSKSPNFAFELWGFSGDGEFEKVWHDGGVYKRTTLGVIAAVKEVATEWGWSMAAPGKAPSEKPPKDYSINSIMQKDKLDDVDILTLVYATVQQSTSLDPNVGQVRVAKKYLVEVVSSPGDKDKVTLSVFLQKAAGDESLVMNTPLAYRTPEDILLVISKLCGVLDWTFKEPAPAQDKPVEDKAVAAMQTLSTMLWAVGEEAQYDPDTNTVGLPWSDHRVEVVLPKGSVTFYLQSTKGIMSINGVEMDKKATTSGYLVGKEGYKSAAVEVANNLKKFFGEKMETPPPPTPEQFESIRDNVLREDETDVDAADEEEQYQRKWDILSAVKDILVSSSNVLAALLHGTYYPVLRLSVAGSSTLFVTVHLEKGYPHFYLSVKRSGGKPLAGPAQLETPAGVAAATSNLKLQLGLNKKSPGDTGGTDVQKTLQHMAELVSNRFGGTSVYQSEIMAYTTELPGNQRVEVHFTSGVYIALGNVITGQEKDYKPFALSLDAAGYLRDLYLSTKGEAPSWKGGKVPKELIKKIPDAQAYVAEYHGHGIVRRTECALSPGKFKSVLLDQLAQWVTTTHETPPPPSPEQFESVEGTLAEAVAEYQAVNYLLEEEPLGESLQEGKGLPGVIKYRDGLTEEEALEKFPWLKEAVFSDAVLGISPIGTLLWYTGTWKSGTWKSGLWYSGTWSYGTWKSGTWKGGVWKGGVWEEGLWGAGIWKGGAWKSGIWNRGAWENGIWEHGVWEDGTWDDGVWKDGIWRDGKWHDGIWRGGMWYNGKWYRGTWEDGVWEGGTWWDGVWKDGTWKDGKWNGGNWEGGTWEGGKIWAGYKGDVPSTVNPAEFFSTGMETPPPPSPEQFERATGDLRSALEEGGDPDAEDRKEIIQWLASSFTTAHVSAMQAINVNVNWNIFLQLPAQKVIVLGGVITGDKGHYSEFATAAEAEAYALELSSKHNPEGDNTDAENTVNLLWGTGIIGHKTLPGHARIIIQHAEKSDSWWSSIAVKYMTPDDRETALVYFREFIGDATGALPQSVPFPDFYGNYETPQPPTPEQFESVQGSAPDLKTLDEPVNPDLIEAGYPLQWTTPISGVTSPAPVVYMGKTFGGRLVCLHLASSPDLHIGFEALQLKPENLRLLDTSDKETMLYVFKCVRRGLHVPINKMFVEQAPEILLKDHGLTPAGNYLVGYSHSESTIKDMFEKSMRPSLIGKVAELASSRVILVLEGAAKYAGEDPLSSVLLKNGNSAIVEQAKGVHVLTKHEVDFYKAIHSPYLPNYVPEEFLKALRPLYDYHLNKYTKPGYTTMLKAVGDKYLTAARWQLETLDLTPDEKAQQVLVYGEDAPTTLGDLIGQPELETPPPPTPEQFESLQEGTGLPGVKEYRDGLTEEEALKRFPWLAEASFKDAVLGLSFVSDLLWYEGTWMAGTWMDGGWQGGIWENGTWRDGIWKDGLWENGIWKGGYWEDGLWKDGRWVGGIWNGGIWESGTWHGGTWKGGTWESGFWESGFWDGGTWKGGLWEKGTWEVGYIYSGSEYVLSKVSPKEFSNQELETPQPPTPEQFERAAGKLPYLEEAVA